MNESDILQKIAQELADPSSSVDGEEPKLFLGFSGGLDSTVLLHLVASSPLKSKLRVIHVHHGLSAHADQWAAHCEDVCKALNVPFQVFRVEVSSEGKGLESAAREQRYAAFGNAMADNDLLLLAHHQNDQAETVLFRLARGTGLNGLAGMRSRRKLGVLKVYRPLLNVARTELESYAKAHHLDWVEDGSNASDTFDRNFIRQHIIPVFERRWPGFVEKVSATSSKLLDTHDLLAEYIGEDFDLLGRRKERLGESLSLVPFSRFSCARKKALILAWSESMGLDSPGQAHLEKLAEVLEAKDDAQPCLNWGNAELRRFDGRLFLLPRVAYRELETCRWRIKEPLNLGEGFSLYCLNADEYAPSTEFEVRSRTNAARCRPVTREHSQTMKKLLQEYRLEPWLCAIVPCVYVHGELVAVADLWQCESMKVDTLPKLEWRYIGA